MPLNLADAIRQQYDALNSETGDTPPAASPRPQNTTPSTSPESGPVFGHYVTPAESKSMNARAGAPSVTIPPTATSTQPFTKPTAPITTPGGVLGTVVKPPVLFDAPKAIKENITDKVPALGAIGGAINNVLGADIPILTDIAKKGAETLQGIQEHISQPTKGLAAIAMQSGVAQIPGGERSDIHSQGGTTVDELRDLMTTPLDGDNYQKIFGRLGEIGRTKANAVDAEAGPIGALASDIVLDPLNLIPGAGIGNARKARSVIGAIGDVTKVDEALKGAPLLARAFDFFSPLVRAGEKEVVGLGKLGLTQDATINKTLANPLNLFRGTAKAKAIDFTQRVHDWMLPQAASEGMTRARLAQMMDQASIAAQKGEITPELEKLIGDAKITNSPDFQRVVNGALGAKRPVEIDRAYTRAQELLMGISEWTQTRRPTVQALRERLLTTKPFAQSFEELPANYRGAFQRYAKTLDSYEVGKGGVGAPELKAAAQQLNSDIEAIGKMELAGAWVNNAADVASGFSKLPTEEKLAQQIMNKIRAYEGVLLLAANPHYVAQNIVSDWVRLAMFGVNPMESAQDIEKLFGRAYGTSDIKQIIGDVGEKIAKSDTRYTPNMPYGATVPDKIRKLPVIKQLSDLTESMNYRSRVRAYTTGFRRAYQSAWKYGESIPALPEDLAKAIRAKGGERALQSVIKKLENSFNAKEMREALRDPFPMWQAYSDAITPALNDVFKQNGINFTLTPEMLEHFISHGTGDFVNEIVANTIKRARKGEDFFTVWDDETAKVNRSHKDYRTEAEAFEREHFKKATPAQPQQPSAPEMPLTQPKPAQAPTPKQAQGVPNVRDNSSGVTPVAADVEPAVVGESADSGAGAVAGTQVPPRDEIEEIAAIRAGQKPIGTYSQLPNTSMEGLKVVTSELGDIYVFRPENEADALQRIKRLDEIQAEIERLGPRGVREALPLHAERGKLLGHADKDIEDFIQRLESVAPRVSTTAAQVPVTRTVQEIIRDVQTRAATIKEPLIKRDILREWAQLFHEGNPENEMRAIFRSIEKWEPSVFLEKAQSYVKRSREAGQTWTTTMADMFEERAHYVLEQIAAGNPKYNTPEYMERLANGDALTRVLRGGENGFDWTKFNTPYEYRPYENFAQYRRRVTDANIERDFINRPAGDTGVSAESAGAGSASGASPTVGAVDSPNVVETVAPATPSVKEAEQTTGSVPFQITRDTRQQLYDLGWARADVDGMSPYTAQKILKDGSTKQDIFGASSKPKGRNASDAQVRGFDPNETHNTSGDYRQRFNDVADRLKKPDASTDPTLKADLEAAMAEELLNILKPHIQAFTQNMGGKAIQPTDAFRIDDYIKNAEPAMNEAKRIGNTVGRIYQKRTTMDYTQRWNVDDALSFYAPFTFYPLHMAANFGMDFLDKPALFNMYTDLQREVDEQTKDLPKRFAHRVRVAAGPFLPDWMGDDILFDPFATAFPVRQVYNLDDLERATFASQDEDQGPIDNTTLIGDMYAPHLPFKLGHQLLTGDTAEIENTFANLPFMRQAKAAGIVPLDNNVNIAGINPTRSKWDDYYIRRELGNMVSHGEITGEQMRIALLTRKGEVWEQGKVKAAQTNYTAPVLSGFTGFTGKVYTEGEQKYNATSHEYNTLKQKLLDEYGGNPAWDKDQQKEFLDSKGAYEYADEAKGTQPGALRAFIDTHPEMERGDIFSEDEELQRSWLVDSIWEQYKTAPELKQKLIAADLGDDFKRLFLEQPDQGHRDYTKIPLEMLTGWANAMGSEMLDTSANPNLAQVMPDPYKLTFTTDAQNAAYQKHYDEKMAAFGGSEAFNALQNGFYALPEKSEARAQYLIQNPRLKVAWDNEAKFYKENPDILKIMERAGLKKTPSASATSTTDPKDAALNQAVLAAGLNWDTIKAKQVAYKALGSKDAKAAYRSQNPDLVRYWNIAGAIYGDDSEQSNNGGGSSSNEPYFKYYPKDTYSKTYGQPRGGGKLEIDFAMLKEANERFRQKPKEPYQGNTTFRIGGGTY
jgi:hypothetical protein